MPRYSATDQPSSCSWTRIRTPTTRWSMRLPSCRRARRRGSTRFARWRRSASGACTATTSSSLTRTRSGQRTAPSPLRISRTRTPRRSWLRGRRGMARRGRESYTSWPSRRTPTCARSATCVARQGQRSATPWRASSRRRRGGSTGCRRARCACSSTTTRSFTGYMPTATGSSGSTRAAKPSAHISSPRWRKICGSRRVTTQSRRP
mmetsp:Transcript_98259/g.281163  ORF Transcript_98259/g.281163 Transcript_98259/m.281163 type:complete len:206 (-) Transcript_98259:351-968(-)